MSLKLYHREVGLPECVSKVCGINYLLRYTKHALHECRDSRYGTITPPCYLKFEPGLVVEAETLDGAIVKLVIRFAYNPAFDLTMVLLPDVSAGIATVKTCWLNRRTDTHRSLDRSRYSIPGETPVV